MPETQIDLIVESLAEAMETLAFVSPIPAEQNPAPADGVLVSIPYFGTTHGTLCLAAPRGLGALIAANILGTEPGDPEAQAKAMDALRELANITCGLWLRKTVETGGGKYEMQVPQCQDVADTEQWQTLCAKAANLLDADGFVVAAFTAGE